MWRESGMIVVTRWTRCLGADHTDSQTAVARWICISGPVLYIYILDRCSSMDNLGAGLLSTWIREILLEISQPNGQSELCDLRVRRFRGSARILHLKLLHLSVGIRYEFQHLLHCLHLIYCHARYVSYYAQNACENMCIYIVFLSF